MDDLKRDVALLAKSGLDWSNRTKRLAARFPELDFFSQRLVERIHRGWRFTDKGRSILQLLETRSAPADVPLDIRKSAEQHLEQVDGPHRIPDRI